MTFVFLSHIVTGGLTDQGETKNLSFVVFCHLNDVIGYGVEVMYDHRRHVMKGEGWV